MKDFQTVKTQIRGLLKDLSVQGLYCWKFLKYKKYRGRQFHKFVIEHPGRTTKYEFLGYIKDH